jgi:nitrite reductase/ring-hydroxylating ferredoxin subunit
VIFTAVQALGGLQCASACCSAPWVAERMAWVDLCASEELPEGTSRVSPLGIAVFRHRSRLYAVEDRCSHGTGRLSHGDIEDIEPAAVVCGALPATTACVRCPRHQAKFGGGLWYSLESGLSLTKGQSSHHAPIYRVGSFACKEEGGRIYVSRVANDTSPKLSLADKINIRVHKAAKAVGCACVSSSAEIEAGYPLGWDLWSVAKVAKLSHDCLIIRLVGGQGRAPGGERISDQHLWHISLRLEVQGQLVERDYTPISSLAEHEAGVITLWIRVYDKGRLTPALQRLLQPSEEIGSGNVIPSIPSGFLGCVNSGDTRGAQGSTAALSQPQLLVSPALVCGRGKGPAEPSANAMKCIQGEQCAAGDVSLPALTAAVCCAAPVIMPGQQTGEHLAPSARQVLASSSRVLVRAPHASCSSPRILTTNSSHEFGMPPVCAAAPELRAVHS